MEKYMLRLDSFKIGQRVETKRIIAGYRAMTGAPGLNVSGKVIGIKRRSRIIYDPQPELVIKSDDGTVRIVSSADIQGYQGDCEKLAQNGERKTTLSLKGLLGCLN